MMQRQISSLSGFRSCDKTLGETPKKQSRPMHRAIVLMLLATALLGLHASRLVELQLVQGKQNRERAENNRVRLVPMPANRGHIVDRKGKLLAGNNLARSVYLWPKEQTPEEWKVTAEKLSPLVKIPAKEILKKIKEVDPLSYRPVRIKQAMPPEIFVPLAEQVGQIRGVEVRPEANRYYPEGSLAAHVLGYIGEATEVDLKAHPEYPMGMIVGQMGIEESSNKQIAGVWGDRLIEVNAQNQELRLMGETPPKPGEAVQLTIDLPMQKAAETALGNRRGAVVAVDVKTGAVLVLASHPTFDPNLFTRKISKDDWATLQDQEDPFLNRAMQGYPPGSTFKIVTSVAGIESGKFSPDSILGTSSYITVGGIDFNEHSGGYGYIGFREALAFSSNTFFYQVGMSTGPEEIAKWGHRLGIGKDTDLNLLGLSGGSHGQIPTPEEKEKIYKEPWYEGDTVTMSIGQGLVLVTPLEAAVMVSSIANGGYRIKPHLLTSMTGTPETQRVKIGMKPSTVQIVKEGLIAVVSEGTGQGLNDGSIPLTGGKTGTSELIGQNDHSLYVAFGPAEKPEIAIAVIVENAGFGAVAAAPIAKDVFQAYFGKPKTPPKPQ
ncbi:penicillin-binding protein 2 [Tychonema sp. LEGE 07199]|uniref:penicillin-binding protein 2 n=1 Tax=unclassified Tychonema TaxID=2642144 RepID=UPI0018828C99|nr:MULTISPECIES: penicillin-binding protein 2 [unclassified Tychonema]MBE9123946.1 penicillin-binding protein 2 [Tychonema sp. LEGE 07199]MBE9135252.1 penicillin-binding protein 2 [Tychonema sp. LEGE 07196]